MDKQSEFERFKNLSFDDFRSLALDPSLSIYQKIGFPDDYRKGKEEDIFRDITTKLDMNDSLSKKTLLDIGPGCSELPLKILHYCSSHEFETLFVDSKEMLDQLPGLPNLKKIPGYFPDDTPTLVNDYSGKIDFIIAYSIFHYVFYNTCIFKFLDTAVSLLKPGGKLLLGDIPNISKRKRFFSTEEGVRYHQNFTQTDALPEISNLKLEPTHIDDGVIMSIIQRYRGFGFETYLLPQNQSLPMYNRREDLLIARI